MPKSLRTHLLSMFSVVYWVFFIISCATLVLPSAAATLLVTARFDRQRHCLHYLMCFWARFYLFWNPLWRTTVRGRAYLPISTPCVIVSNHASILDILLALSLFKPFKFTSKIENFNVPMIGWLLKINGYVGFDRRDKLSIRAMMRRCEQLLRDGESVFFFAEGTRTKTGNIGVLKHGAFDLAAKLDLPVVPLIFSGTFEAMPPQSLLIDGFRRMRADVYAPIYPHRNESPIQLQRRVQDFFEQYLSPCPEKRAA